MMEITRTKKSFSALCLTVLIGCLLVFPSLSGAQPPTHRVVEGDTLWSICEKYYGDADLWPKLWQMNPFVTNPHLLHPGDEITLLEKEAVEETPRVTEKEQVPAGEKEPVKTGIDLSGFTNLAAIGCLSREPVLSWGYIKFAETEKIALSTGDKVVVDFGDRKNIKPGDEFTVYENSSSLRHPLTDRRLGHILAVKGKLVIRKWLQKSFFESEITLAQMTIGIGDKVMPYRPVSPCVDLVPSPSGFSANIVAVKSQQQLIGQYKVVYLDKGFNQGIRRGNLFEVVKVKKIHDPDAETMTIGEFIKYFLKREKLVDFSPSEIMERLSKERPVLYIPLGTLVVVESRPDTSTALVLSATETIYNGSFVRGVPAGEEPEFISGLPQCPIK